MATSNRKLRKALSSFSTNSDALAAVVTTTTSPASSSGAFVLGQTGTTRDDFLFLLPIGTDAADEVFTMQVICWSVSDDDTIWTPEAVRSYTVTLGTATATAYAASGFHADTIVQASGPVSDQVYSPADNTVAYVAIDPLGADIVEIRFTSSGGTAASFNCLYRAGESLGGRLSGNGSASDISTIQSDLATVKADIATIKASNAAIQTAAESIVQADTVEYWETADGDTDLAAASKVIVTVDAGDIKVDSNAGTGVTISVPATTQLNIAGITKIYGTGTTVTGLYILE